MSEHFTLAETAEPEGFGRMHIPSFEVPSAELPMRPVNEGGHELLQIGDIETARRNWEHQGNNELRYEGTCSLASIAQVMRLHGYSVTENDVVKWAAERGLCDPPGNPPNYQNAGGANEIQIKHILKGMLGLESQHENTKSIERIAEMVESGKGVLMSVASKVLWKQDKLTPADLVGDHIVSVVGVARDADGTLAGLYINDTGIPDAKMGAGRLVSLQDLQDCALVQRGVTITIDMPPRAAPSPGV